MKIAIAVIVVVWLVVGTVAANQRHYFGNGLNSCDAGATAAATIATGPLNYGGADPELSCPDPTS